MVQRIQIRKKQQQLLHLVIAPKLMQKIDDFRFQHRCTTRAAAVRTLLESALKAQKA